MRRTLAAVLALCPALAHAGSLSLGAGFGASESKAAADGSTSETLGLFGRLALAPRWSAQLELQRTDAAAQTDVRSGSALMVLDLGQGGAVPVVLAGLGVDRATSYGATTDAHHFEIGIGFELRAQSGFFVGGDARVGTLSIDSQPDAIALLCREPCPMQPLQAGEYRSLRASVGVRF